MSITWEKVDGPAEFASQADITDSAGSAKAVVTAQTPGTSVIWAIIPGADVSNSINVQWLGAEPVDPDPDLDPTPPVDNGTGGGTPGWAKALITILILGAGGAVYMVIRKRRQRKLEGLEDEDEGEPVEPIE